jgi:hypothetical protein
MFSELQKVPKYIYAYISTIFENAGYLFTLQFRLILDDFEKLSSNFFFKVTFNFEKSYNNFKILNRNLN